MKKTAQKSIKEKRAAKKAKKSPRPPCEPSSACSKDLLRAWDGEEVVVRFDEPSATWMFVCVHSTVLGPAAGGTRMKTYAEPATGFATGSGCPRR